MLLGGPVSIKLLLLNPPHAAIGSRIPREHLPPLGLLSIGGPLIDAGHTVRLLDAEFGPMSVTSIVAQAVAWAPEAILLGHSGSTSADPVIAEITGALRRALPRAWIIYGGVFPTYHWRDILAAEPQIDIIVLGSSRLLGGINVGGHRVRMTDLRQHFAELGFANVTTFIASGNVIFDAVEGDAGHRVGSRSAGSSDSHAKDEGCGWGMPTFSRAMRCARRAAKPFQQGDLPSRPPAFTTFLPRFRFSYRSHNH